MTRSITIRGYHPERDAPFVQKLSAEAFAEFSHNAPRSVGQMLTAGTTLIAQGQGRSLGFSIFEFPTATAAHLSAIAVCYEQRGQGIGRELLNAGERLCRAKGARSIELATAESNLEALDLFIKCGFRIVDRRQGFYARGQAACVLQRIL